jgi:hypothetical protein
VNDIKTSLYDGILRSNVEIKNPTPAEEFGRPEDRFLYVHDDVSNPGRCQPWRSPKRPPSLKIPRTLSG